jgi:MFS family permease
VLAGTFFICGLSTSGTVQQHFIPFCADNGVSVIAAASALATIGLFNFIGTIGSGWLTDRFDPRILLAWYYGLRGLSLMASLQRFRRCRALFRVLGFGFIATVPPTVKLAAEYFEPTKAPIVFGWILPVNRSGCSRRARDGVIAGCVGTPCILRDWPRAC